MRTEEAGAETCTRFRFFCSLLQIYKISVIMHIHYKKIV